MIIYLVVQLIMQMKKDWLQLQRFNLSVINALLIVPRYKRRRDVGHYLLIFFCIYFSSQVFYAQNYYDKSTIRADYTNTYKIKLKDTLGLKINFSLKSQNEALNEIYLLRNKLNIDNDTNYSYEFSYGDFILTINRQGENGHYYMQILRDTLRMEYTSKGQISIMRRWGLCAAHDVLTRQDSTRYFIEYYSYNRNCEVTEYKAEQRNLSGSKKQVLKKTYDTEKFNGTFEEYLDGKLKNKKLIDPDFYITEELLKD